MIASLGVSCSRRGRPRPVVVSAILLLCFVFVVLLPNVVSGQDPTAEAAEAGEQDGITSLRTKVRIELKCGSDLSHQIITVFGNGTLRVLDGPADAPRARVRELSPEVLEELFDQLAREVRDDAESDVLDLSGPWAEECDFLLDLPGGSPERYQFSRYSRLALGLAQAVRIVEALEVWVEPVGDDARQLDPDYQPRVGDVLQHVDGEHYIVVSLTTEGQGVELEGVEVPLILYVARDALRDSFTALVDRRER